MMTFKKLLSIGQGRKANLTFGRGYLESSLFNILDLFSNGEQGVLYDPSDISTLFQDAAGTTPVTASGQPLGLILDKSGNTLNGLQSVSTRRLTYTDSPDRLVLDKVDDAIVIAIPTGGFIGSLVVATDEGTASYGVDIPAGDYTIGGQYFAGNSINGILLREGEVSGSDLAEVEQVFVDNGATTSYGEVSDFTHYWRDRSDITVFPLLDFSSGTSFFGTWRNCSSIEIFILIDASSGTDFSQTWLGCSLLTSFPLLDVSNGTSFFATWLNCFNLNIFPANFFDNCQATNFSRAFEGTNLSQSNIDGILVSINSNGTSNGTFNQSGGSAPSVTGEAAITDMRNRGWNITITGGYVSP